MGKASITMELITFIMDNGSMIKNLEKGSINFKKASTTDFGNTTKNMVMEA